MVTKITREEVQRMVARGATVVDPLPEEEYAEEHLAGAINIPLKKLSAATTAQLAQDQDLIVYCFDTD